MGIFLEIFFRKLEKLEKINLFLDLEKTTNFSINLIMISMTYILRGIYSRQVKIISLNFNSYHRTNLVSLVIIIKLELLQVQII